LETKRKALGSNLRRAYQAESRSNGKLITNNQAVQANHLIQRKGEKTFMGLIRV
jgi:hypothetical protein